MIRFAFPAGAWLAVAAAAVLAAYLIRRRARSRTVPFLPLWRAIESEASGGWGARLQRVLDLLLVLVAVGLVAFAAALPERPGRPATVRDLVLVLDGGVSLRAGTRMERLRGIAAAEVRRRAPGSRFAVLGVADDGPTIVMAGSAAEALAAVRAHDAGWTRPSREAAFELALEAARRLRRPDIVVVSDRPQRPRTPFRLRPVAEPAPNAGIAGLELRTDAESGTILARLDLRGNGTVAVGDLWRGVVDGRRTVTVSLNGRGRTELRVGTDGDVFPADDAAYLLLPEKKPPRVLVVADGVPSPFLIAAMQALERTGLVRAPLGRTTPDRAAEASRVYDVLVFDRCAPARPVPGLRALYLDPPAGGVPFRVGAKLDAPTLFTRVADHPLLRGFDAARYPPVSARGIYGGAAILASAAGPALAVGQGWIALGYDPDTGVFAASPAYPLFLRNAVRALAPGGPAVDGAREFFRVGERAPEQGEAVVNGAIRRVGERLLGPPGFWKAKSGVWAVNLFWPELTLAPPAARADPLPAVGRPARPPRPYVAEAAAACLVVLALAWWVFWRNRAQ